MISNQELSLGTWFPCLCLLPLSRLVPDTLPFLYFLEIPRAQPTLKGQRLLCPACRGAEVLGRHPLPGPISSRECCQQLWGVWNAMCALVLLCKNSLLASQQPHFCAFTPEICPDPCGPWPCYLCKGSWCFKGINKCHALNHYFYRLI